MKICLLSLLVVLSALLSSAHLRKEPQSSLVQKRQRLNPGLAKEEWRESSRSGMHMLARSQPSEVRHRALKRPGLASNHEEAPAPAPAPNPVKGCIACVGAQVVYGKYQSMNGDQQDNSYYLFKNPTHKKEDELLPIIIQFHPGGFVSGEPWTQENDEINAYLSKGFAVVSVGCRLVTKKYVFETKEQIHKSSENRTEELIHIAKDGKLSLDSTGRTMEDYQVRVGRQELMTKFLYDATQMIEHLIENAEEFGLDVNRIVFAGESFGGAAIQYLTWVYHKWNVGRYTPRGMVYHNAQLNYPVHNMLGETWDLFVETMGPKVKLADVVSVEACPSIIGNEMCNLQVWNTSDYNLCNEEWNEQAVREFCGDAMESKTLEQVRSRQVWPREDKEVGRGMEKLWYASENMQHHKPSEPFYIYVANSMNGTGTEDISQHSVFALNFAKFAEMGEHGGHQYTVYYTDFAHMNKEDQGMERVEVSLAPGGVDHADRLPPAFNAPAASVALRAHRAAPAAAMPWPGAAPAAGSMVAPAPAPAPAPVATTVFNYLSTHGWREDLGADSVDAGSIEDRVLYACLAAGVGPFKEFQVKNETDTARTESGALETAGLPGFGLLVVSFIALLRS